MNIGGFEVPIELNITGWLSSSWIWVAIVALIGFLAIIAVAIMVFMMTYKRKVIIFEEISGCLQPVMTTRARIIKLRAGGEEVMKTLFGGYYLSAYGQRIGRNSYWYLKGPDGYFYNFTLDKYGTPKYIDGDMRMFNIAIDRLSEQTYGKQSFLEKYGVHMMLFVFLIMFLIGMWIIIGKLGTALGPLSTAINNNAQLTEMNAKTSEAIYNLVNKLGLTPANVSTSGIVPVG